MKVDSKIIKTGNKLPLVEEFFSLQGEGYHTGKAAYFIRIGGCDVGCSWCDSRYSWDQNLHPMVETKTIIENVLKSGTDSVVVTGGEPLMWTGYVFRLKKTVRQLMIFARLLMSLK